MVVLVAIVLFHSINNVSLPVEAAASTGAIYIRADGSIDPPTVPIASADNVTYVFTGNVTNATLYVERDHIVVEGAGHALEGNLTLNSVGIDLQFRINVTITNLTITAFDHGLWLFRSDDNRIHHNTITTRVNGIYAYGFAQHNHIYNNTIAGNRQGILLQRESNGNRIYNNTIRDNDYGVMLAGLSTTNNITGNTFINDGVTIDEAWLNVVVNNSVNGKPLIYLEGLSDRVVQQDAGQVILVSCTNITVQNLTLANTCVGVRLSNTSHSHVTNNTLTDNREGVWLDRSANNTIQGNTITDCAYYGISTRWMGDTTFNTIQGNRIENAARWAFYLLRFFNNTIRENDIINNHGGICLWTYRDVPPTHNRIYHNNFQNNLDHAYAVNATNTWNAGYPTGGNYWSDYSGIDLACGPHQNATGGDGIGDTPYTIDLLNQDNYPLTAPYGPTANAEATILRGPTGYSVQATTNATLVELTGTPGSIQLSVSGEAGTAGYARIIHSTNLNASGIRVFLNDSKLTVPSTSPARSISTNGSHYILYLAFSFNSTYELTVAFPIRGDVNYDGVVDIFDCVKIAIAFGSTPADPDWNSHCDLHEDGLIDIFDFVAMAAVFGSTWS